MCLCINVRLFLYRSAPRHPPLCGYAANLCSRPDHICKLYPAPILSDSCSGNESLAVVLSTHDNPYSNHMNIAVSFQVGDAQLIAFIREAVATGLAELSMAVGPELAPAEAFEDIDFETICGELGHALG